jgi:hypothetical protein
MAEMGFHLAALLEFVAVVVVPRLLVVLGAAV